MQWLVIFPGYFLWHYTTAFKNITHVWLNMLWFMNRLFSVPLLLRTLFSPWKRMTEDEKVGFNLERWAENVVANIMSRIVGAIVRLPIILLGIFALISTSIFGLLFYIFWVLAPVVVVALFLTGLAEILI